MDAAGDDWPCNETHPWALIYTDCEEKTTLEERHWPLKVLGHFTRKITADGFRKFLKDSPFDVMLVNAGGRCVRSRKLHLSPVCTIFLQKLWPIYITLYSFNLKLCLSHNKRLLLLLFCFFSFVFYCEITVLPPCGTTDSCKINFMCVLVITRSMLWV